ncbi:hypothetical protein T492DRAFT_1078709 [Pavlovales sp. CCMP2436]|nr:hypothetical protein T492DRAFT_1078709 [Pavlovales sp. CCMP2436]
MNRSLGTLALLCCWMACGPRADGAHLRPRARSLQSRSRRHVLIRADDADVDASRGGGLGPEEGPRGEWVAEDEPPSFGPAFFQTRGLPGLPARADSGAEPGLAVGLGLAVDPRALVVAGVLGLSALATVGSMMGDLAHSGDAWSLVSAKLYLNGLHSRVYFEQFSGADNSHVLVGAGLPQLGALASGFAGGVLTAGTLIAPLAFLTRGAWLPAGGLAAGAAAAMVVGPPTTVWLLQVAVQGPRPGGGGGGESDPASLLWRYHSRVSAAREARAASGGGGVGGTAEAELALAQQLAEAADACMLILRCVSSWEAARVTRVDPSAAPGAAERALSRLALDEQLRAQPLWPAAGSPHLASPGRPSVDPSADPSSRPQQPSAQSKPSSEVKQGAGSTGLRGDAPGDPLPASTAGAADSARPPDQQLPDRLSGQLDRGDGGTGSRLGARGDWAGSSYASDSSAPEFLVVSVLVAARTPLAVPEALHSIADTREAVLELAAALRAKGDAVLAATDFASPVRASDALDPDMSARDQLYLLFPSLCAL